DYAHRASCVVTGLAPASTALGLGVAAKTAGQAMISQRAGASRHRRGRRAHHGHCAPVPSPSKAANTTRQALTPRECADWVAGVGQALAELTTQLTRAKLASLRGRVH